MKKYIITLSREFGCNAREICRNVAGRLAIRLYDRDLVSMTAERAGLTNEVFHDSDAIIDKNGKNLFHTFGYGSTTPFCSEQAVKIQAEVIRELADRRESAIFFGRCSDYVLRAYPNRLNVFLYAPKEYRIAHMSQAYGISEKSAAKLIKRIDRQHHNYYKYVTGVNRGDRHSRHLMIDVSEFGNDGTVDLICYAVSQKFLRA